MKKTMIGIVPLIDQDRNSYWMLPGYMEGIIEQGGIPVMLPVTKDKETLKQLVECYDGFVFTGGHDINPDLYHEEIVMECGEICDERDTMESLLLPLVYQANKPALGICRGLQLFNVCLGGTLYQDLNTMHPSNLEHRQPDKYHQPIHEVTLIKDTPLYDLLNKEVIGINSLHHQAIKDLSPMLKPMAITSDNLIEAVYDPSKKYFMAVQWHPEFSYLINDDSKKIFKSFVAAMQ